MKANGHILSVLDDFTLVCLPPFLFTSCFFLCLFEMYKKDYINIAELDDCGFFLVFPSPNPKEIPLICILIKQFELFVIFLPKNLLCIILLVWSFRSMCCFLIQANTDKIFHKLLQWHAIYYIYLTIALTEIYIILQRY